MVPPFTNARPISVLIAIIIVFGLSLAVFAEGGRIIQNRVRDYVESLEIPGAISSVRYENENLGLSASEGVAGSHISTSTCNPVLEKIAVPYYWEGVAPDSQDSAAAVVPPLSEIFAGRISSALQSFFSLSGTDNVQNEIPVVKGNIRCEGSECSQFSCEVSEENGMNLVFCQYVPTDPRYSLVSSGKYVATECAVQQCGVAVPAYCLFRDYVQGYHARLMLSDPSCAAGESVSESTSYCDFDMFSQSVYCGMRRCEYLDLSVGEVEKVFTSF